MLTEIKTEAARHFGFILQILCFGTLLSFLHAYSSSHSHSFSHCCLNPSLIVLSLFSRL